jgi:hypothetical protein
MSRVIVCVVAACMVLAACGDTFQFEPKPDEIPLDSIIYVRRARTGVLPADTVSTDTIRAYLPAQADSHIVTFTTTVGWFDQTPRARELKVRSVPHTSGRRVATVVFRSDSLRTGGLVDTATVRAAVGIFTASLRIPMAR